MVLVYSGKLREAMGFGLNDSFVIKFAEKYRCEFTLSDNDGARCTSKSGVSPV